MELKVLADRYELRGLLGEGGMARVYEAHDRVLARQVAVKLLREDIGGGRVSRERMLREARAAASFHHPNAVAVFDTGQEGRIPYIVMELVAGGTLADTIAHEGALEPDRAVTIAKQFLSALAAAHQRGLVHRDVKPANIMLPPGEGAKLADFGIAKGIEEAAGLTMEGQVLGTPKYLSPEQVAGQPATARSDVYAAGVVLYEMLSGAPPFTADNPFAVAVAHQEDAPPRLDRRVKGLDPALVGVVHRCLEKDPDRRFDNADALRQALRAGATGPAPAAAATTKVLPRGRAGRSAPVPAPAASAPPAAPEGRGFGLAVALIMVLALAGVLVFQALGGREPPEQPVEGPTEAPAADPLEPDTDADPVEPEPAEPDPVEPNADEPDPSPDPTPTPTPSPEPVPSPAPDPLPQPETPPPTQAPAEPEPSPEARRPSDILPA